MPHVKHVYVLLPFVMFHVRHKHLGLHIAVSLVGIMTQILPFGCCFFCAITMGCAGFELLFGIIIFFIIIDYYQIKTRN